jgi:hypothetical protein
LFFTWIIIGHHSFPCGFHFFFFSRYTMDKKEVKTPPKQVVPPGNNWWYPKPGQTPLRERCDSVGSDDVSQQSSSPGITSPSIGCIGSCKSNYHTITTMHDGPRPCCH